MPSHTSRHTSTLNSEAPQQAGESKWKLNRRNFLAAASAVPFVSHRVEGAKKKDDPWRVAIIGHSGKGNYGHGLDTMWLELPETTIVAFADANDAGRRKEEKKLKGVPSFADYRKMLSEMKPDIVAVAPRQIGEHHEMIMAAIAAGARGIYCEKPFCRTAAEADEIVKACDESGCRLAVAHRNRYHPTTPMIWKAVEDGAIGELLEIRGRGKEDQRGGCLDLWVLGSHVIDLVRSIAGDAVACSSVVQQGDRPAVRKDVRPGPEGVGPIAGDRLHARFDMSNGLPFYFDSIRGAGTREAGFGFQLIGNAGIIDVRVDREPLAHFISGNPFQPTSTPRPWIPITSAGIGKPEPIPQLRPLVVNHTLAARDLLASIEEKRAPLCSDRDGRAIVEMIQAVFFSHVQGGERVTFPLQSRGQGFESWPHT